MVAEDAGVVPHTPVLEGHQLGKVQTIPTPLEVRRVTVPHIPESSLTESAVQEQEIRLSQTIFSEVGTVPPSTESRDPSAAISLVGREGGDVPDDVIDSMVAAVTSSGDEEEEEEVQEEGEVVEEEKGEGGGEMEEGELADDDEDPPPSLPQTSSSSQPPSLPSSLLPPSTSSLVTTSATAPQPKSSTDQSSRPKRKPIVWDEPSSSAPSSSGTSQPQTKKHVRIQRGRISLSHVRFHLAPSAHMLTHTHILALSPSSPYG
jgi:hypothetical protein